MLKITKKFYDTDFVFQIGFTILCSIVYPLLLSYLAKLINVKQPFTIVYLWPLYILIIFVCIKGFKLIYNWLRHNSDPLSLKVSLIFIPFFFTVGAYRLNGAGDNSTVIVSVSIIAAIIIFLNLSKNVTDTTLQSAIYSIALGLIWSYTLRSSYLVGYDIHQEYFFFNLTNIEKAWDINSYKDPYNACLSITILPTVIQSLTGLNSLIIFKHVYPLLIAIIPVIVFKIGRRFLSMNVAYAGAILYLVQLQYFTQLPALLRQGIAFLFFSLMIDSLIRQDLKENNKKILFFIYGIGLILSHYSTTYVALTSFILTNALIFVVNVSLKRKEVTYIWLKIVIALTILAFFWNIIITDTSKGLLNTFQQMVSNINSTFTLEYKSDVIKNIFFKSTNNTVQVSDYYKESISNSNNPELFSKYSVQGISKETGNPIGMKDVPFLYFNLLIPWIFRLSLVLGVIIVCRQYKNFVILKYFSIILVFMNILMIIIPSISVNYNFERLFQQTLIYLAPLASLGLYTFLRIKGTKIIISIILVSYLFQTSGLVGLVFYNKQSWLFNNGGEYYYRYYTAEEEIVALSWLDYYTPKKAILVLDRYSILRAIAYTNISLKRTNSDFLPANISPDSYVLAGYSGTVGNVVYSNVNNLVLEYTFPAEYMQINKNTIYSNARTKVYK